MPSDTSHLTHNFTIAGGGIAGLATAIGLRRHGASVTVLEQAEAIKEVGAGLQVSPNGARVLRALGLGTGLKAIGVPAQAVELRDYRRPGVVARINLRYAGPESSYYFVHRADLIDLLADAARSSGVRVRLLNRLESVETAPSLSMKLQGGTSYTPDVLIGADGVRSVVRQAIEPRAEPFFTGQTAWRAIVPNITGQAAVARVYMGPHRHVVVYPLRKGKELNIVAVQEQADWTADSWSQKDDPANLRDAFADFGADVRSLLGQVKEVHKWGLFRHPVANRWHDGNAVLVGDAAHPTLPFLAQGGSMALEDAYALTTALARHEDIAKAFSTYQLVREDRVRRVIEAANGNAWKYHLSSQPLRFGAHLGMGLLSRVAPQKLVAAYDWLYGYDVTKDPLLA